MKTNKIIQRVALLSLALGMAAFNALTTSVRAGTDNIGLDWTWDGGSGNWSDANWVFGGGTIAYVNYSPSGTFSASVVKDAGTGTRDATMTVDPGGPTLEVGQVVVRIGDNPDNTYWGRFTVIGDGSVADEYRVDRVTGDSFSRTDWVALTGVNPVFNNVNGTVTVDGAYNVNWLKIRGGATDQLTLAAGAGGLLRFNPNLRHGEGKADLTLFSGNAVIQANITNVMETPVAGLTSALLFIRNESSGTLTMSGNTIASGDSMKFSNAGTNNLTVFNSATFAVPAGNKNVYLTTGAFEFSGSSVVLNNGDLEFGKDGATTVKVNAGAYVSARQIDLAHEDFGGGQNTSVEVAGQLRSSDWFRVGQATTSSVTASLLVTGSGYVNSGVGLAVADNKNNGILTLQNTGSVVISQRLIIGNNGGRGEVYASGTTRLQATGNGGNGSIQMGYGAGSYGYLELSDSAVLSAGQTVTLSNNTTGTAIMLMKDNSRWQTGGASVNIGNYGYGRLTLQDNAQVFQTTFNVGVNVGGFGEFIIKDNVSGTASNVLIVGRDGGRGEVTLSGNASFRAAASGVSMSIGGQDDTAGSSGIGKVTAGGNSVLRTSGDVNVGRGGSGELIVSDQAYVNIDQRLYLNTANDKDGTSGILTISGGTLSTKSIDFGKNVATGVGVSNTACFNLTGGVLVMRAGDGDGGGFHTGEWRAAGEADMSKTATDTQINLGGGTILGQAAWKSGMDMNLTGINGSVNFDNGANTVTLSGALTGDGGLRVSKGTLLLSGVNDYEGQSVIDTGATLRIDGVNTVHLAGLDATTAAFAGAGNLMLFNGKLTLDFSGASGDTWRLFDSGLQFASLDDNWLTGFTFDNDHSWTLNDYVFDLSTGLLTIPEPSTWALLLTGAALLAVLRRRK